MCCEHEQDIEQNPCVLRILKCLVHKAGGKRRGTGCVQTSALLLVEDRLLWSKVGLWFIKYVHPALRKRAPCLAQTPTCLLAQAACGHL